MASSTAAPPRATAVPLARARSVPAWVWLAGLVVVSTLVRYALGRRIVAPWIMVDELIYSELAKSFAASGHLLVRGSPTGGYGPLYPLLISPAYALWDSLPHAYAAVKALNALLLSLAAIPAYLLARRVVRPPLALLAAVLTLALPSLVYSGNVMTENLFLPLFLTAALALVLALERPGLLRTGAFLAAFVLCYLTRPQALALLPAFVTAAVLSGRRPRRELAVLLGPLAAAAVALALVQVARGSSLSGLLGAYEVTSEEHYHAGAVAKWLLYHVAELDLYAGVVPVVALAALLLRARSLPRQLRVSVVATASLAAWLVLEVSAFASIPSVTRIEERYLFYLAPLLFVALLAWLELGLPRGRPELVAALAAGLLPVVLPLNRLIGTATVSDTLQLLTWWRIHDAVTHEIRLLATLCACAAGALALLLPRRYALALPALLLVYLAATTSPIEQRIRQTSLGSLFAGITNERDWIDRRVPAGAEVVALHSGSEGSYAIWENEFFNRRVGRVLYLHEPTGGNLPETKVTADPRDGVLRDGRGREVRAPYVLTDTSVTLAGRVLARDERRGMLLYRLSGPARSTTRVTGLYPGDTWSGAHAAYTRLECAGGSVTVHLQGDPSLFHGAQTVTARVAGRLAGRALVGPDETALRVPLRPARGRCAVGFDVAPTAVPRVATRGRNPDDRVLGVHFNRFDYRAP